MAISKIPGAGVSADTLEAGDLAPNSVDSSELVDGSVDLSHMSANSVDSDQYVDASIDTAHIGDDQVTGAKIENNPTIAGNLTVTGDIVPSTPLSHRNMVINGAMQVWQRATGATGAGNAYNTVDRFKWINNADGNFTSEKYTMTSAEHNTTGHRTAAKVVCINVDAGTTAAGHYTYIQTKLEAQNLQHLQYGTANAKTLTLSFWVKSSLTGTYCVALIKDDSTSYYIPIEYTINTADTWEKKTITISPTAGSTSLITGAGGVINNDNGLGLALDFILSCGSTYHGTNNTWTASNILATSNQINWQDSTSSRTFYLTGIQLELSSNATPFEHRSYGDELERCKRYFQTFGGEYTSERVGIGFNYSSTQRRVEVVLHPNMRAAPTISVSAADNWRLEQQGSTINCTSLTVDSATTKIASTNCNVSSGLSHNHAGTLRANGTVARLNYSAEL